MPAEPIGAIGRGTGAADLGCGQRGVVGEDRRLQPAQLRPRLEAELLTQELTALLEDPQRVGLPPGAVEREHQQPAQRLAEGMGGDELLELDDRPVVKAELELDVQPFLGHRKSRLGQPGDRPRREVLVREIGERIAAPDRVGLGQHFGGRTERAVAPPAPALRQPAARTARCRRRPVSAPVRSRRLA